MNSYLNGFDRNSTIFDKVLFVVKHEMQMLYLFYYDYNNDDKKNIFLIV